MNNRKVKTRTWDNSENFCDRYPPEAISYEIAEKDKKPKKNRDKAEKKTK
jgi:hypothetical protein